MKKHHSHIAWVLLLVLLCGFSTGLFSCGKNKDDTPDAASGDGSVFAESVTVSSDKLTLAIGEEAALTASVQPENVTAKGILWSSTRESVATVDKDGHVKAVSPGRTKILAASGDGKTSAACIVTVDEGTPTLQGVALDASFLQIGSGESAVLTAEVLPEGVEEKTVSWESSDPSVVTVSDGKLTGVQDGSAVITVKTADGKHSASCAVTVASPMPDVMEDLDFSNVTELTDHSCYGGGIRRKSSGEIVFSPTLSEIRNIMSDEGPELYQGYIRFNRQSLSAEDSVMYSYPSVLLNVRISEKGPWVDFYLQSADENCGFCPTAGEFYLVELVIVKADAPTVGLFRANYPLFASDDIAGSAFYDPTPLGGEPPRGEGQFFLRYTVEGSGGAVCGDTRQLLGKDEGSREVVAVAKSGFIFAGWSDGVKTPARSGDKVTEDRTITAKFTVSTAYSLLPEVRIETESGFSIMTQEYESATLSVTGADDIKYNITAPLQIRGRGNSSWNGNAFDVEYDSKNSYRLKFDEKVKFLGVGDSKNRDWILQANKFDLSGLRNYLVWDLANRMGTFGYVPSCTWVQLFINDEYRGMYMVCEHIEVANDRVEVDDTVDSTDKGYFIEFDFRGNYDDDPFFYIDGYGPSPRRDKHGAVEIVIKSQISGDADVKFISDYLTRCHEAILGGNREEIEELVDLPSFIDMFIIEELSKDCDAGRASFFVTKQPGGKLCCTAPWDFDFGFGTYGPAVSPYGFVCETDDLGDSDSCEWYASLLKQSWFREAVTARMTELAPAFEATMEAVRNQGAELRDDANINADFWDLYGRNFHQYVASQASGELNSYDEHIDFLVNWSETRWEDMLENLK